MKNENKVIKTFYMDRELLKIINEENPKINLSEKLNELIRKGLQYDSKYKKITQRDIIEYQMRKYFKEHPEAPAFNKP